MQIILETTKPIEGKSPWEALEHIRVFLSDALDTFNEDDVLEVDGQIDIFGPGVQRIHGFQITFENALEQKATVTFHRQDLNWDYSLSLKGMAILAFKAWDGKTASEIREMIPQYFSREPGKWFAQGGAPGYPLGEFANELPTKTRI